MNDSGIQHKQTFAPHPGMGFDDENQRVPVVMPEQESAEDAPSEVYDARGINLARSEILRGLVEMFTTDATALQTGQRMHLVAYLLGVSDCKTQAELAAQLNISPGRVSQIVRELPEVVRSLCDLKGRTAKAQRIGGKDTIEK